MTEAAWFYAIDGRQRGPVDETTLRSLAAQGVLRREDLVWTDGMADWAAAGTMPWLFAGAPPAAPTPAQPTQAAPAPQAPWPAAAAPASPYAQQPQPASPYAQLSPYAQSQPTAPSGPVVPLAYYAPGHAINYAGFWIRFVAWLIDLVVLTIASAVISGCLGGCLGILATDNFAPRNGGLVVFGIGRLGWLITGWLYEGLMLSSSNQATLGKMAVGIKVVDETGAPISFGRATGRHFAKFISGLLVGFGYIMAAFGERKQGLHDYIAQTYVIYGRGG